jgi:hypothetical protein
MNISFFEKLHIQGIISNISLQNIKRWQANQLLSVHWELKTILYIGVLLLTTGLGILVYKNIDTIGHQAILGIIALISGGSFFYCVKHKNPFSFAKVDAPNVMFDYVLLLGCLTFISFVGYLQFQYQVFGNRFGLATFIPMLVLFFTAYFFDHKGILSLAITNLAAWAGIAVTPAKILNENDFSSSTIIITGMLLGVALIMGGMLTNAKKFKAHFEFTYTNFGTHILFISSIAAIVHYDALYLIWLLVLLAFCIYFYQKAMTEKSFYFLLLLTLYGYIGLSYSVIHLLFFTINMEIGSVYLVLLYFIVSAIAMIYFLMSMNKKLKSL